MNLIVLAALVWGGVLAGPTLKDLGAADFSCPADVMKKSASVPKSVHSLRFADIDIIAALGDSLTAANGAGARPHDPVAVLLQYRGLAFAMGGDKSLEEHVTLPNLLRKFNPALFGYSNGVGSANVWNVAKLNTAVPGATSGDLVGQANDLIRRMKAHPEIKFNDHWKMVSIFIGGNDICDYCRKPEAEAPNRFRDNIKQAIQILKDNLPRTIVVLTGMLDLSLLRRVDKNDPFCEGLHVFECSCEQEVHFSNEEISKICHEYMKTEQEIQDQGLFDSSDDFTVVIQPLFEDLENPPYLPDGKPDLSFFAPDCFHFSQFGHAMVAKNLWNNMIQPVGKKNRVAEVNNPNFPLLCPDTACPFIRTTKNSADCSKYITPAAN